MKFTLSWLKDHLETEASIDEIVDEKPIFDPKISAPITAADKGTFILAERTPLIPAAIKL